ncbi:DNA sulfur modification protein DndB [Streptomyces celluloflavus]|uniref:DNA sulfur modification protein DndB n=1 Tax=Streptomyces celluloflavus TaxID=58344 RepID=A0ABW7RP27_9ACTN
MSVFDEPVVTGLPVKVMVVSDTKAIGILDAENFLAIVEDPAVVERYGNSKSDSRYDEIAELRASVQRLLGGKGSSKAKNVLAYAIYLASGILGDRGPGWSVPPITLWCPNPLIVKEDGSTHLPISKKLIAIDGETQLTAWHKLYNGRRVAKKDGGYGIENVSFSKLTIAFEIYHGISAVQARQIFHDRNLKGVPVDKSLALSMDTYDLATRIAKDLVENLTVVVDGEEERLSDYIEIGKRQIGPNSTKWMTLSGVRTMIVTALLGKSGIQRTSDDVYRDNLNDKAKALDEEDIIRETTEALTNLIHTFTQQFATRTAITAPAVLAGLGATIHRSLSWAEDPFPAHVDVMGLLGEVSWPRDAAVWGGVCATVKANGDVTWGGGAKDSGYKTFEALSDPTSDVGKKVRLQAHNTDA